MINSGPIDIGIDSQHHVQCQFDFLQCICIPGRYTDPRHFIRADLGCIYMSRLLDGQRERSSHADIGIRKSAAYPVLHMAALPQDLAATAVPMAAKGSPQPLVDAHGSGDSVASAPDWQPGSLTTAARD